MVPLTVQGSIRCLTDLHNCRKVLKANPSHARLLNKVLQLNEPGQHSQMCAHVFPYTNTAGSLLWVLPQVFDLQTGQQVASWQAAADTINGASFNPCLPLLATSSGHRRYALLPKDDLEAEDPAAEAMADVENNSSHRQHQPNQGDTTFDAFVDDKLAMDCYKEGSSCNTLGLWQCQAQWVMTAAAAETDLTECAAL